MGAKKAWADAQNHLAGGVNSPVRAFNAVGGTPIFSERAKGAILIDVEGKRYVDYCLSWGALLFGHADTTTVRAIAKQAAKGTSYGTATRYETDLAMEIKKAFPSLEKLRFTSSGTEAAMSAIRLARGATGKKRILKFEGCYHGHSDGLLVKAGSGLATFATPNSAGVPKEIASLTTVLPYNNAEAVKAAFRKHKDIACVIVEPVAGNMGVVPAEPSFLEALRRETRRSGALLIFDEVITGFRVAYGGAQHLYGVAPDLSVLGKIIGGGLPVGAFGGPAGLMDQLSPTGAVYQAGTLSGNPISMAAGLSVLSRLTPDFYRRLGAKTQIFLAQARRALSKKKRAVHIQSAGSMFTVFFNAPERVRDFTSVSRCDQRAFGRFFRAMRSRGVYWPPSAFEASFLSDSHRETELEKTLKAFRDF